MFLSTLKDFYENWKYNRFSNLDNCYFTTLAYLITHLIPINSNVKLDVTVKSNYCLFYKNN